MFLVYVLMESVLNAAFCRWYCWLVSRNCLIVYSYQRTVGCYVFEYFFHNNIYVKIISAGICLMLKSRLNILNIASAF